jgi:hypothetical protein
VAFDSLELIEGPNLALRLTALETVKGMAGAAEPVTLDCQVQIQPLAWRLYCPVADQDPIKLAAARLARGYRIKPVDPGGAPDAAIITRVTVQVAPGPAVDVDPKGATIIDGVQAAWAKAPSGEDLARYYPDVYQRMELGGRVVATCRILDDLSVYCPVVETPPERELFERAVKQITLQFRSEPKLKTGQAAPGAWVRLSFMFAVPQSSRRR